MTKMIKLESRKIKSLFIYIICILAIAGSMTGCSSPSQGQPGGAAPAIVSVWYSLEGKNEQELLKQFERINKDHPEVIVKGVKIPESQFVEQVWNYQAGGEGPEIIIAGRQIITALYEKGAISPVLAQNYSAYTSAKAVFSYNNQLVAAPWLMDIPLLYYRSDIVAELPLSMAGLLEKKTVIAAKSFNTALFSAWSHAEGGGLTLSGVPSLDSPANLVFIEKMKYLRSQGQLIIDNNALDRFVKGEVGCILTWASDRGALTQPGINLRAVSLNSLLGPGGKVLLDRTIAIANSSIKSVSSMEAPIRLVEEELLKPDTESALQKAGGYLPASEDFYAGVRAGSLEAEAATTLSSAYYLEGYMPDWKLVSLQDKAWENMMAGAKVETELTKAQETALEIIKK